MREKAVENMYIEARSLDGQANTRGSKRLLQVLCLLLAFLALLSGGLAWWFYNRPAQGDTGSYLIPKGTMTDQEAQELVNSMAEKSRITISLAPEMSLRPDGMLRVNLIVEEPNNGFSERLEIEQEGQCIYRSGVIDPGKRLEWGQSEGAHAGKATATVYAVLDGSDSGNPISAEIEIVDEGA